VISDRSLGKNFLVYCQYLFDVIFTPSQQNHRKIKGYGFPRFELDFSVPHHAIRMIALSSAYRNQERVI